MGRIALAIAFFALGVNFIALKLDEAFHIDASSLIVWLMCLPAVLLGVASWLTTNSFARSRFVVLCLAIAWVGLLYGVQRQNHRGLINVAYLSSAVFMGALIVENRCWWLCAKVFVLANAFAVAVAFALQYREHGLQMFYSLHRFGELLSEDAGTKLASPNVVGGQLAFAAVLAFLLRLRSGVQFDRTGLEVSWAGTLSIGWTAFLSLGCILTASRGAFIAWLGGMGLLALKGMNNQQLGRLRDLVAVSVMLLLVLLFTSLATDIRPYQTLQARLGDEESVLTISGRTLIWKSALRMWCSKPQYILLGMGTGAVPEAFGEYMRTKVDDDTLAASRLDTHNAFVEWGLSSGLLGLVAGVCLLLAGLRQAHRLDGREGDAGRQAILVCFALASMSYVTYYKLLVVAAGALMVSMLTEVSRTTATALPVRAESPTLLPPNVPRAGAISPWQLGRASSRVS